MLAEPILIDAPEKVKEDRTPAWVRRADWSSNDALLAFWSAHPPEARDDFLKIRAESYALNFWTQIAKHRAEQSRLWRAREELIASHAEQIAKLPADSFTGLRHKEVREEHKAKLLSLRSEMRVSRGEVRRCVRYLRALQPKQPNHLNHAVKMFNVIIPKPQTYTVISLWQPWASMVAWGLKQYETRSWSTSHRGVLLIHAAKRWTQAEKDYCRQYPFNHAIADRLGGAISDLPFGCIVAVAELVAVVPTSSFMHGTLNEAERAVGNFAPGRFAWKLANVRELKTPIPVKGGQGLFKWTGVIE